MAEFIAMGGYGAYVWTAFGFTAASMLGLLWNSIVVSRRRAAQLEDLRRELRPRARRVKKPLRPRRADEIEAN